MLIRFSFVLQQRCNRSNIVWTNILVLMTTQITSQLFSVLRGTHNSPRVDRKYMLMLGFSSGINVIHCLPNMYRVMWPIEKDTLCTPVCAMTATTEPPGKLLFSTNVNKMPEIQVYRSYYRRSLSCGWGNVIYIKVYFTIELLRWTHMFVFRYMRVRGGGILTCDLLHLADYNQSRNELWI